MAFIAPLASMKGRFINLMKKTVVLALTLLMSISLTACGSNNTKAETKNDNSNTQTKSEEQTQPASKTSKILVVYFSRSGNTREIARQIQNNLGGDIVELQTVDPYPREYDAVVKQAKQEIESGYKPALKTKIDNIKSYDLVFVGSPNWWNTIAPPVTTFLSDNDLSGKTIVPFITHAGSGLGRSVTDIAKLCPQSTVLNGFALWGKDVRSSQDEVSRWVRDLKL